MLVASLMACGLRTLALTRYAQLHSGTSSYFHSSTSSYCFTAAPTITSIGAAASSCFRPILLPSWSLAALERLQLQLPPQLRKALQEESGPACGTRVGEWRQWDGGG